MSSDQSARAALSGIPTEWLQPHPVLPLPSRRQVIAWLAVGESGRKHLEETLRDRAELIRLERADPLRYGFEPETYKAARELLEQYDELLLLGGNREGKSNFAAKYFVELLVKKPGSIVAFFHSSEKSSIDQQQALVYSMLPPEWRNLKKGRDVYVTYTKAGGFTNAKFILPNGSTALFFNYKQDVSVMEGYEFDGVWFDELVPLAFLEALTFRLSQNRRTQILITFTPVRGYTSVVASYVAAGEVLTTRPAPLLNPHRVHVKGCPPGHMPFTMRGRRPNSAALFFHNGMNPYGAHKEVRNKLKGATDNEIKIRAYGWADKLVTGAFPKFDKRTHVITRAQFDEIAKSGGTRYCVIDPGGAKNWFIKWYFATPQGHTIVYREWPDRPRYGEWALPPRENPSNDDVGGSRFDWRPGPAQRAEAGRGITSYKRLILELEGAVWDEQKGAWDMTKAEPIARRLMDSRMGGAQTPGEDEGTSIIEMMFDEHRDAQGRITGPSLDFEPAPGSGIEETVQMIVERFDYNDTKPKDILNCPKWYAVEDCHQSILAYEEFTGAGTQKDALKDIVDPDRYYVKAGCEYEPPGGAVIRGGGHW